MASKLSFKRMDSVAESMPDVLWQSRYQMKRCFQRYISKGKRLLKNQQLMEELERSLDDKAEKEKLAEGFLGYIICPTEEAVVLPPYVAFPVRINPGIWEYVTVHFDDLSVEGIIPSEYLKFKETLYDDKWAKDDNSLEVDFVALDLSIPHLTLLSSIGNGMQFVSKFMSSKLSDKPESMKPLLDYLLALNYRGKKQMVNDTIDTVNKLQTSLLLAEVFVSGLPRYTPYLKFEQRFQEWGLEKGWGDTAERCRETLTPTPSAAEERGLQQELRWGRSLNPTAAGEGTPTTGHWMLLDVALSSRVFAAVAVRRQMRVGMERRRGRGAAAGGMMRSSEYLPILEVPIDQKRDFWLDF